jgi:hypothetical protein
MKKTLIILSVILGLVAYFGVTTWAADDIKENDFVSVCKAGNGCGKF